MCKVTYPSMFAMFCFLFLHGACGSRSETAVPIEDRVETQSASISGDEAKPDKALVQVLISGLSLVQFPGGIKREMDLVNIYFPRAGGHGLGIWEGRRDDESGLEWIQIGKDIGSDSSDSPVLELNFPGVSGDKLHVDATVVDVNKFPVNKEAAKSVRWIVPASDLDAPRLFVARGAEVMPLRRGDFETCGLVHPPKYIGTVCKIETEYKRKLRGASEYLIYRFTVPKETTVVPIELKKDGRVIRRFEMSQPVEFRPSIFIAGASYSRVFDVQIGNISDMDIRAMETDHAKNLKPMFVQSAGTWFMDTPGCERQGREWDCGKAACEAGKQPDCIGYFIEQYRSWAMYQGNNRPMCPMVEFP